MVANVDEVLGEQFLSDVQPTSEELMASAVNKQNLHFFLFLL